MLCDEFIFFFLGMLFLEGLKNIKERRSRQINGDCLLLKQRNGDLEVSGQKNKAFFMLKEKKSKSKDVYGFIIPPGLLDKRCTFPDEGLEAFPCGCKSIWRL